MMKNKYAMKITRSEKYERKIIIGNNSEETVKRALREYVK